MINFARIASDSFLLTWNVSSAVTFLLPLFSFAVARLTSQQEYDENGNQQQDGNANDQYYSNPYQNPNNYDQYGNYVGPQHWWEFWKRNRGGEYENGSNDEERGAPWWYIWGEREGGNPEEEGSGAVLFVYLWTLLLFAGLVYVGNTTRMNIGKLQTLRLTLFGFVNYCFVIMVLLVGLEGAIETEGREMEEDGFYGQRSVLLLVTSLFALVQSCAFIHWTNKRLKTLRLAESNKTPDEYVNVEFSGKNPSDADYRVNI